MKKYILLSVVLAAIITSGCFSNAEDGLLQGKVSIGPLSPVEMPGEGINIDCDVYALRKIMVYDKEGKRLIRQVDITCSSEENRAYYQVWLEAGIYLVDINHLGIDSSADVPKTVEITSGTTFKLDIDIDTGIR